VPEISFTPDVNYEIVVTGVNFAHSSGGEALLFGLAKDDNGQQAQVIIPVQQLKQAIKHSLQETKGYGALLKAFIENENGRYYAKNVELIKATTAMTSLLPAVQDLSSDEFKTVPFAQLMTFAVKKFPQVPGSTAPSFTDDQLTEIIFAMEEYYNGTWEGMIAATNQLVFAIKQS